MILENIRSEVYETENYSRSDNFLQNIDTVVPEILTTLLNDIICKSNR